MIRYIRFIVILHSVVSIVSAVIGFFDDTDDDDCVVGCRGSMKNTSCNLPIDALENGDHHNDDGWYYFVPSLEPMAAMMMVMKTPRMVSMPLLMRMLGTDDTDGR
mmetsp:Transcript_1220/g.1314  ORF Transcript_1220/g.1314 Transcript_1220/m.1314 type:complete len:105 (-) Transcript_1220:200-514(-)